MDISHEKVSLQCSRQKNSTYHLSWKTKFSKGWPEKENTICHGRVSGWRGKGGGKGEGGGVDGKRRKEEKVGQFIHV